MTAHTEALARLREQGYTPEQAHRIVAGLVDPTPEPCATCQGTGWVPHPNLPHTRNEPCRDCNGTGEDTHDVEQSPVIEVDEEYELDELTGQWRRIRGA